MCLDVADGGHREMGTGDERIAVGVLVEERSPRLASLSCVPICNFGDVGVRQLERMVQHIAGDDEWFRTRLDPDRSVSGRMTRCREQPDAVADVGVGGHLPGEAGVQDRGDGIGEGIMALASVVSLGPVQFLGDVDVACVRKSRHPQAIGEVGVPPM